MWLIDTQSLVLKEAVDASSSQYAILSHTWEDDEFTFQDITKLKQDDVRQKAGFRKIQKTCELARQKGLQFAWVDTCCIDKSSSAELSEAINSMFAWYKHSTVCFVFLSDLPSLEDTRVDHPEALGPDFPYNQALLSCCRWFSRGWTLQELIAPQHVEFFNSKWQGFSHKSDCLEILSGITGIPQLVLKSPSRLRQTPVAVKMAWAASRKTKRIEDRAYSLLGIFDINMPMIYGEGHRAFHRLQEEIARGTNDLSLFAWKGSSSARSQEFQMFRGIFARSPSEFSSCANICKSMTGHDRVRDFSLTNQGVRIETKLYKHTNGAYVMYLGFTAPTSVPVCISLTRTVDGFARSEPWSLEFEEAVTNANNHRDILTIHVPTEVSRQEDLDFRRQMHRSFQVAVRLPEGLQLQSQEPNPAYLWDKFHETFISPDPHKSFAAKLNIIVRGIDGTFTEDFPLTLSMGWTSALEKPFAVLYGTRDSGDPARSVRNIVPGDFPDLVKDHLEWGHSHEQEFENALSKVCSNPAFQAKEVRFINQKTMILHRGARKVSAQVATFRADLETHETGDSIITYRVSVSGVLTKEEGRNAISSARLYVPARASD